MSPKEISIEPEYPEFDEILKECKQKMELKFFEYGNSWKYKPFTLDWWLKRLDGEIKEIHKSKDAVILSDEIIDAINVLCMLYERIGSRCQKCKIRLINFQLMNGEPICVNCFLGNTNAQRGSLD